jgi:hypothetical protein
MRIDSSHYRVQQADATCRERAITAFHCSPILGAWKAAGYEDACAYAMLVSNFLIRGG